MSGLADVLNKNMVRRKNIIPDVDKTRTPVQVQKGINLWNRDAFDSSVKGGPGTYKGQPIRSFKKGGMVHKTGVYRVHKGEMVMPKKTVDTMHKKWMLSDGGAVKYSDHSDS